MLMQPQSHATHYPPSLGPPHYPVASHSRNMSGEPVFSNYIALILLELMVKLMHFSFINVKASRQNRFLVSHQPPLVVKVCLLNFHCCSKALTHPLISYHLYNKVHMMCHVLITLKYSLFFCVILMTQ